MSNNPQLSQEWFAERAGLPTASNFDKIVTSKGEPSKQVKKYMYQLAGERITGVKQEGYTNQAMERGIELECMARSMYEVVTGIKPEVVGLCWKDDKKTVGASVDGLVGDDGSIEVKCPEIQTHVEYLLENKLPTKYFQQVQGQLYATGRKWVDFVSYYPGMKLLIVRVERDEKFLASLGFELDLFCKELGIVVEKIK